MLFYSNLGLTTLLVSDICELLSFRFRCLQVKIVWGRNKQTYQALTWFPGKRVPSLIRNAAIFSKLDIVPDLQLCGDLSSKNSVSCGPAVTTEKAAHRKFFHSCEQCQLDSVSLNPIGFFFVPSWWSLLSFPIGLFCIQNRSFLPTCSPCS